ncbi:MAG: hypothetical protein HUU35_12350 [Armatimonadetes bacterium]|nr:hypothetical protein [Armatimonadota bacterium]
MAKRVSRGLLLLLGLVLLSGCKKEDKWGEDIGAPPADVAAIRERAKQKKSGVPAPAPTTPRP